MDRRGRGPPPAASNPPPHNHRRNTAMIKLQTIRQTLRMSPPAHLRPGSEPLLRSNSLSSPHIPSSRYRNILLSRYQNDVPAEFAPLLRSRSLSCPHILLSRHRKDAPRGSARGCARWVVRMSLPTWRSPETPRRVALFRATGRISARGLFGLTLDRCRRSASRSSNRTSVRTLSRTLLPCKNHPARSHHAWRGRFPGRAKVRTVCSSQKGNGRS